MRFVWPAQRYDRLTRVATLVAAAITTCAGFAIVVPAVRIYRSANSTTGRSAEERVETVTFIQPRLATAAAVRSSRSVRSDVAPIAPAPKPARIDTSSFITSRVESSSRADQATNQPSTDSKAAPRALGPYSASAAVRLGRIDSGAAPPLPWGWVPPTQAQRDSAGRAEWQRAAAARDDHRPLAITLGSIPMRMPFGGAARSSEQRARDSVVNEDYLKRLARLGERVRAKRESTFAARTVARRDSGATTTPRP